MTPERKHYNEVILPKFIKEFVKPGDCVIDVGKPNDGWGYREMFKGTDYKTLDCNINLKPDILDDMEDTKLSECADVIICYGVTEQCENPFKLVEGLRKILKPGGYGLIGIMSIGFPMIQDWDLLRFTAQGAGQLLQDFELIDFEVKNRGEIPSQIYAVVKKGETA